VAVLLVLALGACEAGAPPAPEAAPTEPAEATAQEPAAPAPEAADDPAPDLVEEADVLGGLATLLRDGVLDCAGDRDTPDPRRVDADDAADLRARVAEIRDLDFAAAPPFARLSDVEMAALVAERFGGYDDDDAASERRVLSALGAVPSDADLRDLRVDVFADQVSGLYRRDTGGASVRMRAPEGPLSPLEQVVAAHELQHALADQRLGRPAEARDARETRDERRASLAVVEGDASLTMHLYAATSLTAAERDDLRAQLLDRAAGQPLATYPDYLRRELRFPYDDGLAFVCDVWRRGGWRAVDALYAEPPTTSAHILWPERHRDGEPAVDPGLPAAPGRGWEQVRRDTFGAAELLWLLEAPGGDPAAGQPDARALAAAWAGGRVLTWADGDRSAVGVALVQRPGEPSLCTTMRRWWRATARGGAVLDRPGVLEAAADDRVGVVLCDGDRVVVGIAPDAATARRIAAPS
jgi:hypothetical protein